MGLYNRLCKRFFAAVIIRLTAQSDSRAPDIPYCCSLITVCIAHIHGSTSSGCGKIKEISPLILPEKAAPVITGANYKII